MKKHYLYLVLSLVVLGLALSRGIAAVDAASQAYPNDLISNTTFSTMGSAQVEEVLLTNESRLRLKYVGIMKTGLYTVRLEDSVGHIYFSETDQAGSFYYDLVLPAGEYKLVIDCTQAQDGAYRLYVRY